MDFFGSFINLIGTLSLCGLVSFGGYKFVKHFIEHLGTLTVEELKKERTKYAFIALGFVILVTADLLVLPLLHFTGAEDFSISLEQEQSLNAFLNGFKWVFVGLCGLGFVVACTLLIFISNSLTIKGKKENKMRNEKYRLTLRELIKSGVLTKEQARAIKRAIRAKVSVVICGPIGSGKTTLLNALLPYIRGFRKVKRFIENDTECLTIGSYVVSGEMRDNFLGFDMTPNKDKTKKERDIFHDPLMFTFYQTFDVKTYCSNFKEFPLSSTKCCYIKIEDRKVEEVYYSESRSLDRYPHIHVNPKEAELTDFDPSKISKKENPAE